MRRTSPHAAAARRAVEQLRAWHRDGVAYRVIGERIGVHEVTVKSWVAPRAAAYHADPGRLAVAAIERAVRVFARKARKGLRPRWECPACLTRGKGAHVIVDVLTDSPPLFQCPTCRTTYLEHRGGLSVLKGASVE